MRSCLHSVSLPDIPVLDFMRRARDGGYHSVELNAETLPWAEPHVTPNTSAAERTAIVTLSKDLDLPVWALGAHVPMVDADGGRRRDALAFILGCVDLAYDLGTSIVHVLSGPLGGGTNKDEAWPWFSHAVRVGCQHAHEKGIAFAVEAIAGHMFCLTEDYHRLFAELSDLPVKVMFDPSHLIVQAEDPLRVVSEFGDRIVHMHAKDGAGRFPDFTFPPLGQGNIDFPALKKGLEAAGYGGAVSVEYEAQVFGFDLDEATILRTGREFLTKLEIA